jgi:hypothetical protein
MPFIDFGIDLGDEARRWLTQACDCCRHQFNRALQNTVFDVIALLVEHEQKMLPCVRSLRARGVSHSDGLWIFEGFAVRVKRCIQITTDGQRTVHHFLDTIRKYQPTQGCDLCTHGHTIH